MLEALLNVHPVVLDDIKEAGIGIVVGPPSMVALQLQIAWAKAVVNVTLAVPPEVMPLIDPPLDIALSQLVPPPPPPPPLTVVHEGLAALPPVVNTWPEVPGGNTDHTEPDLYKTSPWVDPTS